jgi:hypothetical protein
MHWEGIPGESSGAAGFVRFRRGTIAPSWILSVLTVREVVRRPRFEEVGSTSFHTPPRGDALPDPTSPAMRNHPGLPAGGRTCCAARRPTFACAPLPLYSSGPIRDRIASVSHQTNAVIRRAVATVLALCLVASLTEAVAAQVRTARSHPPAGPTPSVTLEPGPRVDDAPAQSREDESRRLHHHSDDHEHDPAGEHCVHHHTVGPITAVSPEVPVGLTADRDPAPPPTLPGDRTRAPATEPPRA